MEKLHFDYYMQIDYSTEVSRCNFTIKCVPRNNARQQIENFHIEIFPAISYNQGVDGLRNIQIYGVNGMPHKTFYFRITGDAVVGLSEYEEFEDEDTTMIFRHPHGLNVAGESIQKYYESMFFQDGLSDMEKVMQIMHSLHQELVYQPCSTTVETSAEEAFLQRKGVCQDYAHIFIALLHLAHIPARYVTGLIVGEGASHAWVEVLLDGKWYGFDPTNDTRVQDEHIKIGIGRDAHDCMINRGIMHGGGLHIQTIKVQVNKKE